MYQNDTSCIKKQNLYHRETAYFDSDLSTRNGFLSGNTPFYGGIFPKNSLYRNRA